MVIDSVLAMKTNSGLLDVIKRVSSRHMTSRELIDQRVSFVYGSMDEKNGVTREKIRQVILSQVGGTDSDAK